MGLRREKASGLICYWPFSTQAYLLLAIHYTSLSVTGHSLHKFKSQIGQASFSVLINTTIRKLKLPHKPRCMWGFQVPCSRKIVQIPFMHLLKW